MSVGVNGDLAWIRKLPPRLLPRGSSLAPTVSGATAPGLNDEQTFKVERATVFSKTNEATCVGVATGQVIARGVNFARDLVNGPGYAMHPPALGDEAVKLGQRVGLKVTVLDMAQLIEQGFGGILAVGKGSEHEPRFIVMEYGKAEQGHTDHLPGRARA